MLANVLSDQMEEFIMTRVSGQVLDLIEKMLSVFTTFASYILVIILRYRLRVVSSALAMMHNSFQAN